uniref:Ig-like domain-containing protein n=1 Tax=Periophthalmus magnuspinnatus TaxID=409849 RepID=A0A3B3ZM68_9GOBI
KGFTSEEFLDIIGIMRNQAGRYECKASNDVATPDFKYVNVVVNYPPTIQKIQSSETPVGRVGMLQCDANAVPKPEFEWFKDDKSINIQMLGTTTILVFSNVSEEDYGNYTCVASNRLGIQYASVFLFSDAALSLLRGWTGAGGVDFCLHGNESRGVFGKKTTPTIMCV